MKDAVTTYKACLLWNMDDVSSSRTYLLEIFALSQTRQKHLREIIEEGPACPRG